MGSSRTRHAAIPGGGEQDVEQDGGSVPEATGEWQVHADVSGDHQPRGASGHGEEDG
jgi:hypothetical protein